MPYDFKIRLSDEMGNIAFITGEIVVRTGYIMPLRQELFDQVRAQKSCSASYQYTFSHFNPIPKYSNPAALISAAS